MKPYPPLATLGTAALLRKEGFGVRLFDAMLAAGVRDFCEVLEETRPAIVGLVEDNFNFLTKMCTVRMREAALEMIRAANALGCRVAVNGSDANDCPGPYLEAGADAVILGEPEYTMLDLARLWSRDLDAPLDGVGGLALPAIPPESHRREMGLRRTPPTRLLEDLDALPFPDWSLVDLNRYREAWTAAHGRLSWNMVASRGCPYRCNWCAKPLFGSRYAQRSPANVAEELRQLRESVGPDHIWFADDIFGLTAPWIRAFAAEVTRRSARTPFTIQSRVNLMKPEVVVDLAVAGAEEVWLGVESGSQDVLDAMDKGTTVEHIRAGTRSLKAHGIRACWFIQLGYLGEEWDDILLTRDLLREERPDDIGVSVSYPLPGTKFYQIVREQLGSKTNWVDSDELAMMFRGTFDTAFYRRVRNLLHDEIDQPDSGGLDRRWTELERLSIMHRTSQPAAVLGL
jgi:anaerobic magnesium-protoporphyrin IX monomethyl ester cyclase